MAAAEAAGAHPLRGLGGDGAPGGLAGGSGPVVAQTAKWPRWWPTALLLCGNAYLGDLVPEIRKPGTRHIGSYIVATEPLGDALAEPR